MLSKYVLILVWIGAVALLNIKPRMRVECENGIENYRYSLLVAFIIFLPIILIAGFRTGKAGGDVLSYITYYNNAPNSFKAIPQYLAVITKDKGFFVLTALIKCLFGDNYRYYFLIIGLIQGFCVLQIFRKYSTKYVFSVFLFIASTDYMAWMLNGMRQFLAVAIIFAGTSLYLKKKHIKTICLILFASLFHQSALIMLPIVFICQGKAFNWKTLLMMVATVIAIIFVEQFTDFLDESLTYTQYNSVVAEMEKSQDNGTHPLRVLFYSLPTILAIINYKSIKEAQDKSVQYFANMSMVSTAIYFISMFTSGIFIGRLPIYSSLYGYLLLPWEINILYHRNRTIIFAAIIVGYLVFYYIQMRLTWGYF